MELFLDAKMRHSSPPEPCKKSVSPARQRKSVDKSIYRAWAFKIRENTKIRESTLLLTFFYCEWQSKRMEWLSCSRYAEFSGEQACFLVSHDATLDMGCAIFSLKKMACWLGWSNTACCAAEVEKERR